MSTVNSYPHPELDRYLDDTFEDAASEALDRQGARAFMEATPDFYPCSENAEAIQNWLNEKGACGSERNFCIAYDVLQAEGKLKERPQPKPEPLQPQTKHKPTLEERGIVDLSKAHFIPEAVTDADRKKYADNSSLTDHTRKKRFEQLKRDAVAERYARLQGRQ